VQEPPSDLQVIVSPETGPLLGFASAVTNLGAGPLIVDASRPTLNRPTMLAEQVVLRPGRAPLRRAGAGELVYVESPDHSHWHFAPFERYELRRVAGLPAGRYVLVHWVNGGRRLLESDHSNNAASVLLRLSWRDGQPHVTKLKVCPASATCPRRPAR
jgi:hypothetical protein